MEILAHCIEPARVPTIRLARANLPGAPVVTYLTPEDARLGYQCDECADRAEGRGGYE